MQIHASSCDVCQKCKASNRSPKAPLVPIRIAEFPMQFISIDIAHMPTSINGKSYLLVIGDLFSKYIQAVPLVDQTAQSIINALYKKWTLQPGCPAFLLSDKGSNVYGNDMDEICKKLCIVKSHSSAYHSQGNGFAERNIRSIREVLRTYLLGKNIPQKEWSVHIDSLIFALNTSLSSATKFTPFEIVFGRNPTLPVDQFFGTANIIDGEDIMSTSDYEINLRSHLKEIYEVVRNQLNISRDQMKKQYDKNVNHHIILSN